MCVKLITKKTERVALEIEKFEEESVALFEFNFSLVQAKESWSARRMNLLLGTSTATNLQISLAKQYFYFDIILVHHKSRNFKFFLFKMRK